jgi:hypothetical protein
MSEQPPEREHNSPQISPIRKYYFDVERTVDCKTDAVMAMSRLIDSLPSELDITIDSITSHEGMPFDWEYDHDLRIAKEKLAILPLLVVGPQLDESSISSSDLKEWYDDAIRGIKFSVKEDHTTKCLEHEADWNCMCESSTYCPVITAKKYLLQDAEMPDFSSKMYENNLSRGFEIATAKLAIGVEYELLEGEARINLLEEYKKMYIRHTVPLQIESKSNARYEK